mmetsp:Transcript_31102/g.57280  ORF Transcript_31102/g.57280 Transcript_31102/m.57280 type:complete len:232 (+) Transcript_31102:326-1021(+)
MEPFFASPAWPASSAWATRAFSRLRRSEAIRATSAPSISTAPRPSCSLNPTGRSSGCAPALSTSPPAVSTSVPRSLRAFSLGSSLICTGACCEICRISSFHSPPASLRSTVVTRILGKVTVCALPMGPPPVRPRISSVVVTQAVEPRSRSLKSEGCKDRWVMVPPSSPPPSMPSIGLLGGGGGGGANIFRMLPITASWPARKPTSGITTLTASDSDQICSIVVILSSLYPR